MADRGPVGRGTRAASGGSDRGGDRRGGLGRGGGTEGHRGDHIRGRNGSGRDERVRRDGDRPRRPRVVEPELPEHTQAKQLDPTARRELRTLSKDNADGVARHLVATGEALAQDDLDRALAHALAATRRAGRVAAVREALGLVLYRRGEWAKALSEFRTARRLSGSEHLLPHMADAERGLGRPERAIELSQGPQVVRLAEAERVELAIVVAGARRDMGQLDAARQTLEDLARGTRPGQPWAARVYYALADSVLASGSLEEARTWFARAAEVDEQDQTDADDRLAELDGLDVIDLDDVDPS